MRIASLPADFVIALGTLAFSSACDDTPTRPTPAPLQTSSSIPASPPMPAVVRFEMSGPQVVTLNTTAQFRVIAHLADGSSRDATEELNWEVSDDSVFAMVSKGLFRALATPGEARIAAYRCDSLCDYTEVVASRDVMALAPGTYKLRGVIWEEGSPTGPVSGAHLELRASDGSIITTDTSESGEYQFYGVSGEVRLRVTREGYERVTKNFTVSRHLGYDVWLPLVKPRLQIAGTYTLTLTASDQCAAGSSLGHLPEDVSRVRTYRADVKQAGPNLEVVASAPSLRENFARLGFGGTVEPGRVIFNFLWVETPYLVEDLPGSRVLTIDGLATTTGSDRLSGTFWGSFIVYEGASHPFPFGGSPVAGCYADNHRFELSR